MRVPAYTVEDFAAALANLLPRGRVWQRDPGTVLMAAIKGLAGAFNDNASRSRDLLGEAFPPSTLELLPEWEESLGLPDPCIGPSPTIVERRNQVVARFVNVGGQSVSYFIALAAQLGYAIEIEEFSPFRFGADSFGTPLYGDDWANAWQVDAALHTMVFFQFGISEFGEPFAEWQNLVLECEMTAASPAHTKLLFSYT